MSKVLEQFIKETYTSRQVPDFRVGDIVKVHQIVPDIKIQKKLSKTAKAIKKTQDDGKATGKRTQIFEGIVIAKKHGKEPGASFTVRKIASHNVGVEKIFPIYSPLVKKIEVVSRPSKVRRSKLYFLRDRVGKKARRLGVGTAIEQEITSVGTVPGEEVEEMPDVDKKSPEGQDEKVVEKQKVEEIKKEKEEKEKETGEKGERGEEGENNKKV